MALCRSEEACQQRITRRHRGRLEHSSIKGDFSALDYVVRSPPAVSLFHNKGI